MRHSTWLAVLMTACAARSHHDPGTSAPGSRRAISQPSSVPEPSSRPSVQVDYASLTGAMLRADGTLVVAFATFATDRRYVTFIAPAGSPRYLAYHSGAKVHLPLSGTTFVRTYANILELVDASTLEVKNTVTSLDFGRLAFARNGKRFATTLCVSTQCDIVVFDAVAGTQLARFHGKAYRPALTDDGHFLVQYNTDGIEVFDVDHQRHLLSRKGMFLQGEEGSIDVTGAITHLDADGVLTLTRPDMLEATDVHSGRVLSSRRFGPYANYFLSPGSDTIGILREGAREVHFWGVGSHKVEATIALPVPCANCSGEWRSAKRFVVRTDKGAEREIDVSTQTMVTERALPTLTIGGYTITLPQSARLVGPFGVARPSVLVLERTGGVHTVTGPKGSGAVSARAGSTFYEQVGTNLLQFETEYDIHQEPHFSGARRIYPDARVESAPPDAE
jgi:hypothetical protein